MKPLTAKALIADMLAEGWPGDREAHKRAVSRLVADGNDVLASNLAVAKEIKRLMPTGAN